MSQWPRQHELASPSRQDLPFHLKGARVPKLTETMSFASPRSPNSGPSSQCQSTRDFHLPKRFRSAAVGTSPSAFIRGAVALHNLTSSGQHRSPVCGPTAGPCPYAHEQEHEENEGTDHAVCCDPLLTQSAAAHKTGKSSHSGTTKPPTSQFSPPVSRPSYSSFHRMAQVAQERRTYSLFFQGTPGPPHPRRC